MFVLVEFGDTLMWPRAWCAQACIMVMCACRGYMSISVMCCLPDCPRDSGHVWISGTPVPTVVCTPSKHLDPYLVLHHGSHIYVPAQFNICFCALHLYS